LQPKVLCAWSIDKRQFAHMNRKDKFVIVKNAFANVARGSANALVTVALPPVLTRAMTTESYGAWALVLQLGAYVGYFDFGLQSAVGRFVAHSTERGDRDHRDGIVSTSAAALIVAGVVSFAALTTLALLLPEIFRNMNSAVRSTARIALLFVSGSLALGLPASVFHGIFVGLQRNEVAASIIGGSRVLSAALVAIIAWQGGGLVAMAIAFAAVNLGSYAIAYFAARRVAPDVHFRRSLINLPVAKELLKYCSSLTIWSAAMLLVTGLDLMLVAIFQYSAVPFYAVAAGLVTFLSGLLNAVFSALVPAAAVLHARNDSQSLGRMLIRSSRYGTFLLIFTGLPLMLFATPILRFWVGAEYAIHGSKYLIVLVLANVIRLFMTPYAVTLIGTGQQRLVILAPVMEAGTNLIASLVLGHLLGAIGVAYGTLCGAVVGVLLNLFYSMPRTTEIRFGMREYLYDGLLRPITFSLPLLFCFAALQVLEVGSMAQALMIAAAVALSVSILWLHGLRSEERARLLALLRIIPSTAASRGD
jgi:O-antigen/teichoic acid export membrane protein